MKKSGRIVLAALIAVMAAVSTGCGSDENLDINTAKPEVTEAVTEGAEDAADNETEESPAEDNNSEEAAVEQKEEEKAEETTEAKQEEVTEETTEEKKEEEDNSAESSENSWIEAYQNEVQKFASENEAMYELMDITGDDIPELFISRGEFHAAGVTIFTIVNGEAVNLGEFGSFGEVMYDASKKTVRQGFSGQGHTTGSIFRIEDGKENVLVEYDSVDLEDEKSFKIDGAEVTEEEYNSALEQYGADTRLGRKFTIDTKVSDAYNG